MTASDKIKEMMADAYDRYQRAAKNPTDANKYRANFYKGRYEAFREALIEIENDRGTNRETA